MITSWKTEPTGNASDSHEADPHEIDPFQGMIVVMFLMIVTVGVVMILDVSVFGSAFWLRRRRGVSVH